MITVRSLKFDSFKSLAKLRYFAETEFSKTLKLKDDGLRESYISAIKGFDFFDSNNYKSSVEESFMTNLSNFRDELLIVIDKKYNKKRSSATLKRQISPSLSAYNYKGNSKIDINETGRDYGLLFE